MLPDQVRALADVGQAAVRLQRHRDLGRLRRDPRCKGFWNMLPETRWGRWLMYKRPLLCFGGTVISPACAGTPEARVLGAEQAAGLSSDIIVPPACRRAHCERRVRNAEAEADTQPAAHMQGCCLRAPPHLHCTYSAAQALWTMQGTDKQAAKVHCAPAAATAPPAHETGSSCRCLRPHAHLSTDACQHASAANDF